MISLVGWQKLVKLLLILCHHMVAFGFMGNLCGLLQLECIV